MLHMYDISVTIVLQVLIQLVKATDFYGFHNTPYLQNMLGKFAGEPWAKMVWK